MAELDAIRQRLSHAAFAQGMWAEAYASDVSALLSLVEEHLRQLDELEDEVAALRGVEDEDFDERMTGAA